MISLHPASVPEAPLVFRNRMAAFAWGFTAVWLAMLLAMSWVALRDGPPDGHSDAAALGVALLLWAVGIGVAFLVSRKPCVRIELDPGRRVSVTWRYPHKVVRKTLPAARVLPAELVELRDSEGAAYWHARVKTLDGESIDFHEGHRRSTCQQAVERFNAGLRT